MQRVTASLIKSVSASQVLGDPVNGQFVLYKGLATTGQTVKYDESAQCWFAADSTFSGASTSYLALTGGTLTGFLTGTTAAFNEISASYFYGDGSRLRNIGTRNALPLSGGTLTGFLTGTTAAFNEISASYFYGDGSRLRNIGTPNALPLSGGTITSSLALSGTFSVRNMLLDQEDEGAFFGRTRIKENNIDLLETTIGAQWRIVPSTAEKNWIKIATSSDGKVVAAAAVNDYIYVSKNYGVNWSPAASTQSWSNIAMSLGGKIMIATTSGNNGQVYITIDYGTTWNSIAALSNKDWRGVAISTNGKFQTAVAASNQIYASNNYGTTWTAVDSSRDWRDVAMSSDGRLQTAVVHNGFIYMSTNYGGTWHSKGSSQKYNSISMGADGKVQVATINEDNIINVSSNYGETWQQSGEGQGPGWTSSAVSSDGKYVVAGGSLGFIYSSSNYGQYSPWTNPFSVTGANFRGVAMSSDAKIQYAVVANGSIYTSNATSILYGSLSGTFIGSGAGLVGVPFPVISVAGRLGAVTITSTDLSDFTSASVTAARTIVGVNDGIAPLNSSGKIPLQHLPGTIAQLVTATNIRSLTALTVAELGRDRENLYLANDTAKIYRYSGVAPLSYVEIVSSPGDTDSVPEGLVGTSNRTNRYYTGAREDELLKRAGGTMTGTLRVSALSFFGALSSTSLSSSQIAGNIATFTEVSALSVHGSFFGDGSRLRNVIGVDIIPRLPLSGGALTGTGNLSVVDLSGQRGIFFTSLSAPMLLGTMYGSVSGATGTFTTSVSAPMLSGSFFGNVRGVSATFVRVSGIYFGDGSNLTGVISYGGDATKLHLSGGALTGTGSLSVVNLSGQRGVFFVSLSAPALSGGTVRGTTGTFTNSISSPALSGSFFGSIVGSTATFSSFISAPALSGSHFGDGSGLTGIVTSVAGRVGVVSISSTDLADFTSAAVTAARTIVGVNNGIAPLSNVGKIPLQYIPGSISQLITATNLQSLTALTVAELGRDRENLYLANNTSKIYRYTGVAPLSYVEIVTSPGDTDTVPEGSVATTSRGNRYYTGTREDEVLKKAGGTMTGTLVGTIGAFSTSLSAPSLVGTVIRGDGSNLTGIVRTVAGRTGAVTITTADLSDFNSAVATVTVPVITTVTAEILATQLLNLSGAVDGLAPLDSTAKLEKKYLPESALTAAVNYVIDGAGQPITVGSKGYVQLPTNFTIQEWSIVADATTSSFELDVRKASYDNFPATNTIFPVSNITLYNSNKNRNTSLLLPIDAGDFLEFYVVNNSGEATMVCISLKGSK